MAYCSPDRRLTYFDTSSFYTTTLHLISVIAIPTHIFGAYCILFRTPPRMRSVKWSLLNLHFWTCFLDILLSLLTTPFIVVPLYGGYATGILTFIGVPAKDQVYLTTTTGAVMGVAIAGIFENRYHVLNSKKHWWHKARIPWAVMNYVIALTYFLPVYFKFPDQDHATNFVLKMLPCIQKGPQSAELFLISENPTQYMSIGVSEVCFLILQVLVFCQFISWSFRQQDCKLSARTIAMQRKLMHALNLQLAIPMCIIVIPLAYCTIATICGYYNQALNNFSFIIISSHGLFSTIAMISTQSSYRQVFLRLFRKPSREISPAVISVTARQTIVFYMWRKK